MGHGEFFGLLSMITGRLRTGLYRLAGTSPAEPSVVRLGLVDFGAYRMPRPGARSYGGVLLKAARSGRYCCHRALQCRGDGSW